MPAAARFAGCVRCAGRCLAGKGERREIERWTDEDVIERHRARMRLAGKDMMRRRKALAEHPFGTLKCRAGYRHFLVRGFDKVRGEWSLMALCYNFSRVLRIIGLGPWMALLAQRAAKSPSRAIVALLRPYCPVSRHAAVRWPSRASIRALRRGLGYSEMTYRGRTFLPSLAAKPICCGRYDGFRVRSTHPTRLLLQGYYKATRLNHLNGSKH